MSNRSRQKYISRLTSAEIRKWKTICKVLVSWSTYGTFAEFDNNMDVGAIGYLSYDRKPIGFEERIAVFCKLYGIRVPGFNQETLIDLYAD